MSRRMVFAGLARARAQSIAIAVALLAVGCMDTPTETQSPHGQAAATSRLPQRPGEANLQAMAAHMPEFAGIFRKGNAVTILATNEASGQRGLGYLRGLLRAGGRSSIVDDGNFTVRRADYSFTRLAQWRDHVAPRLYDLQGWTSLEIGLEANKILVGVTSPAASLEASRLLRAEGVPDAAFRVFMANEAQPTRKLKDRARPMMGGNGFLGHASSECTLGPIAVWGADTVLLVNSHCTDDENALDPPASRILQPFTQYPNDIDKKGPEIWDTYGYTCGGLNLKHCREADIAVYSRNDMGGSLAPLTAFGYIARPTVRNAGSLNLDGAHSVTDIDEANPILITGVANWLVVGDVVDKIGQTTGWTYGPITSTCVDRNRSFNRVLVCQSQADYNSDGGDSGSPVFYWNGSTAVLAGINWGNHDASGYDGLFSSWTQMKRELGSRTLKVHPVQYVPPSTEFAASMAGGTDIDSDETGTWGVNLYNSTRPVTCTWYLDGAFYDNSSCTVQLTFHTATMEYHNLQVVIMNGDGQWREDERNITVHTAGGDDMLKRKRVSLTPTGAPGAKAPAAGPSLLKKPLP